MNFLVNIDVDDLDRAVEFYTTALGFQVGRRFGLEGVELLGGPAPVYLLLKVAGTSPSADCHQLRDFRRHWTPVHLDIVVADIEEAVERVLAAGGELEGEVRTSTWGMLALMTDPFGHGFCLVRFLGQGYDEIAT